MEMAKISVEEALLSYGFSAKETKIYLACLELGVATANRISERSDTNRSTTYDILKAFLEQGIAFKIVKNKTTYFEVVNPERFVSILNEKKNKLESVMDQLKLMQETKIKKPVVEMYEGREGVKTILDDILNTKAQTDVICTSKIFDIFVYYFPHYIQQRKELGIFCRLIQEDSLATKKLKSKDKIENRETRSIKKFGMNSGMFIYGEKVAMIKLLQKDLWGILIYDKTLTDDKRKVFETLWANAK